MWRGDSLSYNWQIDNFAQKRALSSLSRFFSLHHFLSLLYSSRLIQHGKYHAWAYVVGITHNFGLFISYVFAFMYCNQNWSMKNNLIVLIFYCSRVCPGAFTQAYALNFTNFFFHPTVSMLRAFILLGESLVSICFKRIFRSTFSLKTNQLKFEWKRNLIEMMLASLLLSLIVVYEVFI